MCATCGCSDDADVQMIDLSHAGAHTHPHGTHTLVLEQRVLARNDEFAQRNRRWLTAHQMRAVNLMSSPGAGKTTLLERTIRDLGDQPCAVIEGDQETALDAARMRATGCPTVQVNTGTGCHLDALMVASALQTLQPPRGSVVFIENVGNLVCPALFDLGEHARVVITSVTEGAEKPLKYPHMFRAADTVLLNKIDLLPYVPFDVDAFRGHLARVNPRAELLLLSATRGDGLHHWYHRLDATRRDPAHADREGSEPGAPNGAR